jgi:Fibronectin type III domain
LLRGADIRAKVQAINSRGGSILSDASTELVISVQTVPTKMTTPFRNPLTTPVVTQIDVEWNALSDPANGGSAITSYFLEWDAGTTGTTWSEVVGLSPLSTLTKYSVTGGSSGLTIGASYQFRVTARNKHGWGTVSDAFTLKAAQKPSTVSLATFIDSTTGGIKI